MAFYPLFYSCDELEFLTYICWTILASMWMIMHSKWSFWYAVGFDVLVFNGEFLHTLSSVISDLDILCMCMCVFFHFFFYSSLQTSWKSRLFLSPFIPLPRKWSTGFLKKKKAMIWPLSSSIMNLAFLSNLTHKWYFVPQFLHYSYVYYCISVTSFLIWESLRNSQNIISRNLLIAKHY